MARIESQNKDYAGVSAGVQFTNGVGATNDPEAIEWFRAHGYSVDGEAPQAEPAVQEANQATSEYQDAADQSLNQAADEKQAKAKK